VIILGINAYHADSSAAIFVNGKLIAAIEEERFTRTKHWAGFPAQSISFCLQDANVTLDMVDHIAIGRDPKAKLISKLIFAAKHLGGSVKAIKERLTNAKLVSSIEADFSKHFNIPAEIIKKKIRQVEHHRSHLASAFYASPFENAALLSIDGSGDFTTTMIGVGKSNKIEVLDSINYPYSLGLLYTAFTQFLGFPHYGDEYKIMGLASYGVAQPQLIEKLRGLVDLNEQNGLFSINMRCLSSPAKGYVSYKNNTAVTETLYNKKFEKLFGIARRIDEPVTQYHQDIAASIQFITEETIFHILNHLHRTTGLTKLCIAGGVSQNSVAMGKITRNTAFTQVYIPPAAHDAGISIGAALYIQHQVLNKERYPVLTAYTGSVFTNEEIELVLKDRNVRYEKLSEDELYNVVTDQLINAGVVGWFSGRSEFGPRALGARSILADPRRTDAKELINSKIKRRESFRPFAPSILKEYVEEYFEANDMVPFMEKVFPIRKSKQSVIPAVTHVDGTGRLQTVDRSVSPRFYALIETFRQKTGVPILLNTSFNENEPIVNTPAEALDCFLRTGMDMLVLENFVITRKVIIINSK
jgi:carbamoyltransferase